jgi:quercetin dioxygenase-like cupin family protein
MHEQATSGTVVDLFTRHLRLELSGTIRVDERRMTADDVDWRLALFHVETAEEVHPDYWEMHPLADEAVCCLRGRIRLYLRAALPGRPDDLIRLEAGRAVIVPRDRWHRFAFDEPAELLAVTVRRGTQLEEWTGSDIQEMSVG